MGKCFQDLHHTDRSGTCVGGTRYGDHDHNRRCASCRIGFFKNKFQIHRRYIIDLRASCRNLYLLLSLQASPCCFDVQKRRRADIQLSAVPVPKRHSEGWSFRQRHRPGPNEGLFPTGGMVGFYLLRDKRGGRIDRRDTTDRPVFPAFPANI